MAASMLARLMSKGISKMGKKESSEVAKKGTELMGRRDEKFMGMAEEVTPKRLSGPASAAEEVAKRGGSGKAIAAGVAAAGAAGAAALSGRSKEDKEPTKVVSASRVSEGKVTKAEEPTKETSKAKESSKPATFGAAFKEARSAGKDTFTYEGKKYTTEMASEKKAASKAADKPTGVREGRNEGIDDDTRKRAMASVSNMNKGGMVKYAKGGYVNCGASVPPAQKAKK